MPASPLSLEVMSQEEQENILEMCGHNSLLPQLPRCRRAPGSGVVAVAVPPLTLREQQRPRELEAGTGESHQAARQWPLVQKL